MSPWGQEALAHHMALLALHVLRCLGNEETTLEDLYFSPWELERRARPIEDLDDDELEELDAHNENVAEEYEANLAQRQRPKSLTARFEDDEL